MARLFEFQGKKLLTLHKIPVPRGAVCTTPDEAAAWCEETTGPFAFALFPGDHFFIRSAHEGVLRMVARALCGSPAPAAVAS